MAEFAPTIDRVAERVFLIIAHDGDGSEALRDEHLAGHLAYVEKHCDQYLAAGPMRNPGETSLSGSFFLVAASDDRAAREFLDGDPYMRCGMYKSVVLNEVTPAAGRWMGGVIWESVDAVRAASS